MLFLRDQDIADGVWLSLGEPRVRQRPVDTGECDAGALCGERQQGKR